MSAAADSEGDGHLAIQGDGHLADVLPSVACALGVSSGRARLALPPAVRTVVFLVDGLGANLLARRAAYAPFLAEMAAVQRDLRALPGSAPFSGNVLTCGFPSTTATSMATFGTGQRPGGHGMLGYTVVDPERDVLFNELSWEHGPDPMRWQSQPTVFEQVSEDGVSVYQIGPAYFAGSGLTIAALRGAAFVAAATLDDRVDAAARVLRSGPRVLVYLYWGDVDKVGHARGWASEAWAHELSSVDLAARQLAARVPADTSIVLTADHGMVDIPCDRRLDLADDNTLSRSLAAGVRHTAGEPRAPMLFCEPGEQARVVRRWREELGADFDVRTGHEAITAGWFGAVRPHLRNRVGDVIAHATSDAAIHDTRVQRKEQLSLIGMHGAQTADELLIPLLVIPPRVSLS